MGRASVLSFLIDGCDMRQLAAGLDQRGIAVSAGYHRAKPLHTDYLKIGSTMRASAYIYTTQEEICAFVEALRECVALRWGGA